MSVVVKLARQLDPRPLIVDLNPQDLWEVMTVSPSHDPVHNLNISGERKTKKK